MKDGSDLSLTEVCGLTPSCSTSRCELASPPWHISACDAAPARQSRCCICFSDAMTHSHTYCAPAGSNQLLEHVNVVMRREAGACQKSDPGERLLMSCVIFQNRGTPSLGWAVPRVFFNFLWLHCNMNVLFCFLLSCFKMKWSTLFLGVPCKLQFVYPLVFK